MLFVDIPGLEEVKEKLWHTIQTGKVAHAQLFCGNPGSANLAMALAYATAINCTSPKENDACGTCPSCIKSNKLIHPDLHFAFPVSNTAETTGKKALSETFITDWRKFVAETPYGGPMEWSRTYGGEDKQLNISREESREIINALSLKSFEGKYKIMIVWLAEYMHPSAANALLKLLEEPPENTLFLLVTYNQEQIISTILSRTQTVNIPAFKSEEIAKYLISKHQTEEAKAKNIANVSDGNMNEAVRLIQEINDDAQMYFQEWMRQCYDRKYQKLVARADSFSQMKKIEQKTIFQYGLNILRESLVAQTGKEELFKLYDAEKKFVVNFSKTLNFDQIERLYKLLNTSIYHLERNANPKILFLDTSLLISSVFKSK